MFVFSGSVNGVGLKAVEATGNEVIGFVVSLWYFYRKRTVVNYFRAISSRETPAAADDTTSTGQA